MPPVLVEAVAVLVARGRADEGAVQQRGSRPREGLGTERTASGA